MSTVAPISSRPVPARREPSAPAPSRSGRPFAEVLAEGAAISRPAGNSPLRGPPAPRSIPAAAVPPVVTALGRLVDLGTTADRLVAEAARGGALPPERLLAVQVTIYRYDEALQLTSQVTDRADAAIKEVLHAG